MKQLKNPALLFYVLLLRLISQHQCCDDYADLWRLQQTLLKCSEKGVWHSRGWGSRHEKQREGGGLSVMVTCRQQACWFCFKNIKQWSHYDTPMDTLLTTRFIMCNNQPEFDFQTWLCCVPWSVKRLRGRVMYARLSRVSSRLVSRYVKLAASSSRCTLESCPLMRSVLRVTMVVLSLLFHIPWSRFLKDSLV